ncbi:hypothetical protein FQN54_000856 [Arachnomyces sp. PD_36]|nr:hypothetical protein FQN54_000856 [Arachnomyces sp. PD_36]
MFAGLAAPSIGIDINKERHPPPPATPLDFPNCIPTGANASSPSRSSTKLCRLLGFAKKAQDISPTCLEELNLTVTPDVPISHIVPRNGEHKPRPPPPLEKTSDQDVPGVESMTVQSLMSNGNPFPAQEKYDLLKKEILVDNEDAFREVTRMAPLSGRPRIRVAHTRKFWVGLERMSQYWDSSHDRYIEPTEKDIKKEGPESNGKMEVDGSNAAEGSTKDTSSIDSMDIDSKENDSSTHKDKTAGEAEAPSEPTTMYTGRRVSNGSQMPEDAREETVRGFLEMIAWSFGCQAHVPSLPPRLAMQNLLFPVRVSFALSRSPQDRQVARKGILEGPLFIGQCRNETVFHGEEQTSGHDQKEMCDLLREVGTMLLTAQERAREGTTEVKPGDGKWWTTKPRWGGLSDQGVTGEKAPAVEDKPPDQNEPNKRSRYERSLLGSRRSGSGSSRKMSVSDKWKLVQPGPGLWDKKMRYMQIGKVKDSEFDDIFMISSINHHISILHLRVHPRYLQWLAGGDDSSTQDTPSPSEPWQKLELRRTKWFDLLKAEDRLQALDGIWGLFEWMMRA